MTLNDATESAERIRQAVAVMRVPCTAALKVTVSIGIAAVIGGDPYATLENADAALYRAKEGGRNRCVAITGTSDERRVRDVALHATART